ncbi:regulatory protein, luxR family [Micromonospora pallida]|uniref:Regulatory protein, luxR family n=1 Tax=Micromonospora pallida TaxID=145854 RepID=A0A1C6SB53_9ACTN|nr:helix-turn-helix transcriptional regulator [Micromonospora pallida]SCL26624.1 regulatory protein, luxR family [Micromonospora pallida]
MNEAGLLRAALIAAHAIINNEPFVDDLAAGLLQAVGADCVCIDICRAWRTQAPSVTMAGEPDALSAGEIDQWMTLSVDDPYVGNLLATGDARPYRTSDFMTFNRFRQTSIYREVFAQYGMRHLLVMAPRITDEDLVLIGLTRRLHDFSDRETRALHPVRDVIATALDYQAQITAIQGKIGASLPVAPPRHCTLTERENQVLALIATGHTNDQAARKLGISPRTIRKHLEGVFVKADVPSRAAAVAWWLRQTPTVTPRTSLLSARSSPDRTRSASPKGGGPTLVATEANPSSGV